MKTLFITVLIFTVGAVIACSKSPEFKAGDTVQVEWKGKWYPAAVKTFDSDKACWNIHYDNYSDSWDECVDKTRIKAR